MRPRHRLVLCLLAFGNEVPRADDPPQRPRLSMTEAVVCNAVNGFGDFEPRGDSRLSRDEKMLLYYEPKHFRTEPYKKGHRVRLTQDVHLRRRGTKAILWKRDDLVRFEGHADQPPREVYLTNTISLKTLPAGEYDLDLILHDRIEGGPPVTQTVKFSVVTTAETDPQGPRPPCDPRPSLRSPSGP